MDNLIKSLSKENWDYFAEVINNLELKYDMDKRVSKEMGMLKNILSTTLSEKNRKYLANGRMLVKMYHIVSKYEKYLLNSNIENKQFVVFLRAIYEKLKTEKLSIYKNYKYNAQFEFKELKRFGENEIVPKP